MWGGTPIWSPDGERILYFTISNERPLRMRGLLDGQVKDVLIQPYGPNFLTDWSPDGRYVLFNYASPTTGADIWLLDTAGQPKPSPLLQTAFIETYGQFSPDGKWVAYSSNETGRPEVYIASFPKLGGKIRVSANGGILPKWSRRGNELFYVSEDRRRMLAVSLKTSAAGWKAGAPEVLFDLPDRGFPIDAGLQIRAPYAVSKDGQRFLINAALDDPVPPSLVVGLNWRPAR